ncbi:MAG: elongation factor P [Patescibacteria group bacterium]|nr:MAG: elongation factor P [Patescibacteria group bacterium]
MLSVTELRKGAIFVDQGKPYLVLEYRHTKLGRGTANIRVKAKDLKSGAILEKTFVSGASVGEGEVIRRKGQYLYSDGESLYFMDPKSFEQFSVPAKLGKAIVGFLKEGTETTLVFFEDDPVSIEIPLKVDLKVVEAPPGNKGDTKQGGNKEVVLETGYKLQAPLFVKVGDTITVNTESGIYTGRAS